MGKIKTSQRTASEKAKRILRRMGVLPIAIIVLLLVLRAFLPSLVKRYVTHTINKIPGYRGEVEDIDIHLWRGAYGISGLKITKIDGKVPVPFFSLHDGDLSIQWKELFHGALVGKIILTKPQLNFVSGPSKEESQTSIDGSWQDRVQELFPLDFNYLKIADGSIHFQKFDAKPPVDIHLDDLQVLAQNLSNSREKYELLLASLKAEGKPMGHGRFQLDVDFNPLVDQPTFKLETTVDDFDLSTLNNFARAYSGIIIKQGKMNLYCEVAAKEGSFTGYVKPFLSDLNFADLKDKKISFSEKVKGTFAEFFSTIFKNRKKDSVASRIEFSGRFEEPKVRLLTAIGFAFRHAFIQSLSPEIEHTIELGKVKSKS